MIKVQVNNEVLDQLVISIPGYEFIGEEILSHMPAFTYLLFQKVGSSNLKCEIYESHVFPYNSHGADRCVCGKERYDGKEVPETTT